MTAEATDTRKIDFLEWLWLRHSDLDDPFYPLAHLILSNSVDPSPWKNKPSLNPLFVLRDIQGLYATRRHGVSADHVHLAEQAVQAYMQDDTTVTSLVESRKKRESLRAAQAAPFIEADIPLTTNTSALTPRCVFTDPSTGRNCRFRAEPGDTRCRRHGGTSLSPQELQAAYKSAKDKLVAATEQAVDITIELMENSPSDEVRRKAAEMILDRTGLVPGQVIQINSGDTNATKSPSQILLERLQALADSHAADAPKEVTPAPPSDTIDIVDAELVEEDPT